MSTHNKRSNILSHIHSKQL